MRITKCLIVIGCFMLLTMSVCFAKISEVNDRKTWEAGGGKYLNFTAFVLRKK